MKKVSLFLISVVSAFAVHAQDFNDALRYSESFVEGNARYMAMGGALSSLGGNLGAVSTNPASSAVFKKSVVEFTPTYIYTKSENYFTGYNRMINSMVKVPNWGIICYKPLKQNDVFVSGLSFGFVMNAQNRYAETLSFTGYNNKSSVTDWFENDATLNLLARNSHLIRTDAEGDFTDFITGYGQFQDFEIDRDGVKREYLFNFGIDFSEWVFFGVDLSITDLYYNEKARFTEQDRDEKMEYLDRYTYSTNLDVQGTGAMGKFGLIARPIEYLRIGAALHTPTVFNLKEEYDMEISSMFDQPVLEGSVETEYRANQAFTSKYKVGQPSKFVGSLGFVYKNVLNIGVDIEHVNYSSCSLKGEEFSLQERDSEIANVLTSATNLKCGGEFRYGPFSFRAGYAMYGDPYKNKPTSDKYNFYRQDFSAGVGLATNTFYYDLAVVQARTFKSTALYRNAADQAVNSESLIKNNYVMFTAGFKF